MKVLLVEDHAGMAKVSCDLLRSVWGHQVEHAATGQAALDAARKNIPDIVLLDLSLPDMHGYRVAEQLRSDVRFDQTVLVALTGFGMTGDPALSKAAGIDAHYRKPMDFGELTEIKNSRTFPSSSVSIDPLI